MRCKNCGWPNKPNEVTCVKCHSPLSANDEGQEYGMESHSQQSSSVLNKTVAEENVFGNVGNTSSSQSNTFKQTRIESNDAPLSQCPKCGYPLRPGSDKCPNCKFQVNAAYSPSANQSQGSLQEDNRNVTDSSNRPTRMASSGNPKNNFRGTINPYMMNVETAPTFVLKPLKRIEERHEFEEQEYEGKEVFLNRENTESNNPSITSKTQAVIKNVEGHWFIEDKSEQNTTFVQASQKIELHDGDIILLGNRLFEFRK